MLKYVITYSKLRCPRNFIHINLFCAFAWRTIVVMIVGIFRSNSSLFDMNLDNSTNDTDYSSTVDNDEVICRYIKASLFSCDFNTRLLVLVSFRNLYRVAYLLACFAIRAQCITCLYRRKPFI